MIEDFLYDFRQLYPERRLTPKMHYLIHVPSWMLRYEFYISYATHNIGYYRCGPLTRLWCMRFEAKHSLLKQMSHVIKNFKNIPNHWDQRQMCYRMADIDGYLN